jgi:hypothetical protein
MKFKFIIPSYHIFSAISEIQNIEYCVKLKLPKLKLKDERSTLRSVEEK